MIEAYRHDSHKFSGHPHENAPKEFAGVPVNRPVPKGADGDAATMSRPRGRQEPVAPSHVTYDRLSLLTGESAAEGSQVTVEGRVRDLLAIDDAELAHDRWLHSDVAGLYNESVAFPYTSLKYHTLLVAAFLDNYHDGHRFGCLRLVVDASEEIVPHRTIYDGDRFSLRIDVDACGSPSARLGSRPWQSWASTWSRLTDHPLETDRAKWDMTLDANLRRIWSWSTALQYLEDFEHWRPDR